MIFENRDNTIFVFFKNYSYSLNLIFFFFALALFFFFYLLHFSKVYENQTCTLILTKLITKFNFIDGIDVLVGEGKRKEMLHVSCKRTHNHMGRHTSLLGMVFCTGIPIFRDCMS